MVYGFESVCNWNRKIGLFMKQFILLHLMEYF